MDKEFSTQEKKSQFKQDEQEAMLENHTTEIDDMESASHDPFAALADELTKTKEQLVRVTADFSNFKKRMEKDRADAQTFAQTAVIMPFLNTIDDFERALALSANSDNAESKSWIEGFQMIYRNLCKRLEELGVTTVDCSSGFNPVYHEALMSVDAPDKASGDIVEVLSKGYLYRGVVIRCAKVSVAK